MGLFSFKKDAGEKSIDTTVESTVNAASLVKNIETYGFDVTDLDIEMEGDTAKVYGVTPDQATREKVLLSIGNTQGVAHVEDKMTTKAPEPEAKMHTIQSGESLSKIAKQYYGDPMKYTEIVAANQPLITDPDKIYPGQVIRIPNLD